MLLSALANEARLLLIHAWCTCLVDGIRLKRRAYLGRDVAIGVDLTQPTNVESFQREPHTPSIWGTRLADMAVVWSFRGQPVRPQAIGPAR